MAVQTQLKKELEGNKWFDHVLTNLQKEPRQSTIDFEIIITQAIVRYLNGAIDFKMFIEIIDRVGDRPDAKAIQEIDGIITQLLSLSQYNANPQINKKSIITTFSDVITQLDKLYKKNYSFIK